MDALWSRELGTVYIHVPNVWENFMLWELTGILPEQMVPPSGAFPD